MLSNTSRRTRKSSVLRPGKGGWLDTVATSKSFRIYNPATWKVLESRNVICVETPSISPDLGLEVDLCDDLSGYFTYEKPEDFLRDIRDNTPRLDANTPLDFDGKIEPNSSPSTPELLDLLRQLREITDVDVGRAWSKKPDANEGSTPASNAGVTPSNSSAAPGESSSTTGGASSSDIGRTLFKVTHRATRSASHSTAPSPVQSSSRSVALRNGGGAYFVQDDARGQGSSVNHSILQQEADFRHGPR